MSSSGICLEAFSVTKFSKVLRTCPDRPWGPPSLVYNGYQVFPMGKKRLERDADPSPLLVPWSRKGRAIPLPPLWAVWPVQSLSACTRVHFTFTLFLGLQLHQTFQMHHHHHHHWRDWIHLHHQGFYMTWHTVCALISVTAVMRETESVSETLKCLNHLMQQSTQADWVESSYYIIQ